ncbi:MAG: transposase, partial [Syntrophomonadaceae bacterium]|nr:transposase [Syntrophomonadaceae bacterium]
MKTYKYRLYPTKQQNLALSESLETCRTLYNAALSERKYAYRLRNKSIRRKDQQSQLPAIKECLPEIKRVHSQVLQEVLFRVDRAFDAFFRRIESGEKPGYPRFKGKNWYDSFTYPQSGFSLSENSRGNQKLKLSKIGDIKVKLHRPIKGTIKTLTIKRELGKWYACFSVDEPLLPCPRTGKEIGIDVGLKVFARLSDGKEIENPRCLLRSESKLKYEQRKLSRRHKGSNARRKQRYRLARLHKRIANQRRDFLHQESRKLVQNYDVLVFEDIRVKNLLPNHHLAKSIADASWGKFIQYVSYKAESAGKKVVLVNPRNTSQTCSNCGLLVNKSLSQRIHKCTGGLEIDRDLNAAINILRLGTGLG